MLQKKIFRKENGISFSPLPFLIKKERKNPLAIVSNPIPWESLNEQEKNTQWAYCTNRLWEYEKEGVISLENAKPYIEWFLRENSFNESDLRAFHSAPSWLINTTILSVAFLLKNVYYREESAFWLKNKLSEIISQGFVVLNKTESKEKENVVFEKPKRSIQEIMAEQRSNLLGELQGLEDEMLTTKHDILNWLRSNNVAKVHLDFIEGFFRPRLNELFEYLEGEDPQILEAYASYKKSEIKRMIEWYDNLLTDVDAFRRLKVSTRKIRIRKPKPPAQLVKRLKFLNYSEDYKIQSINPEKIIGATTLWVFNTKYRKLCVYNASELEKQLTVKGSTILGWDPKTSYSKTLRKPEEQLTLFMNSGKVAMKNFLKEIKGKAGSLNGRINKEMLLLKHF